MLRLSVFRFVRVIISLTTDDTIKILETRLNRLRFAAKAGEWASAILRQRETIGSRAEDDPKGNRVY